MFMAQYFHKFCDLSSDHENVVLLWAWLVVCAHTHRKRDRAYVYACNTSHLMNV